MNPVSLRLKNTVKTLKRFSIVQMAEKQLMNEHVRTISNIIEHCVVQRYSCMGKLTRVLDKITMKECQDLLERIREVKHQNILEGQRIMFNRLCLKGNGSSSN